MINHNKLVFFRLQDVNVVHIQEHAAVDGLHRRHAVCEHQYGATSLVALQCLRNLAQGSCLLGDLHKAEEQLKRALKLLDSKLSQSANTHAAGFDVIKVGTMLELAEVMVELGR